MKIKVKNFRCYLEKEFDFGEDGLLLLSGHSGCGKSSILMAIMFALYGTGNKLITFGKTSLRVEMEFGDLQIIRTKKPNRLVVVNKKTGVELEDEAGQGVINDTFGTAFDCTSYVQQNANNSFIMMSPLDKLAFLEKFAFHGINLAQLKGRCQSIIKKRNEELISTTSQLELSTSHFKTLKRPERVNFPIKTTNKENSIKNESIRLKNTRVLIKRAEKKIDMLGEELTNTKIFSSKQSMMKETILKIQEKIRENETEKNTIQYEGDEKLQNYETELKYLLMRRELSILEEKYSDNIGRFEIMKENEIQSIREKIKCIKNSLWKEYTCVEVDTSIIEYKQLLSDVERLEILHQNKDRYQVNEEKIAENKKLLEKEREKLCENKDKLSRLRLQQELYECPSCHVSLKFQEDELQICNEHIVHDEIEIDEVKKHITIGTKSINRLEYIIPEEETKFKRYLEAIDEIKKITEQYEDEIPSKDELESSIEYLKEYKRVQNELEKRCKKLEDNIKDKVFSSSLEIFKKQISVQKDQIKMLENNLKESKCTLNIEENDLRHIIQVQKQNKEKVITYEKYLKELSSDLKKYLEQLHEIEHDYKSKYSCMRSIDSIESELAVKIKELEELKINCEKHEENMRKIDMYNKYKEDLSRYIEWEVKVQNLTELEEKHRKQYAASTLLKDKILEAESIAILNIINSINVHAQEYLDIFFPNDPIVVRLLPFKQTKKMTCKPQINLEIDYKGMEADISMLSGGELARVVLAYTLALAEIFNSPLLMLDESTASLDQDMTSIVMDGIRKNFGNKLTIVIAHQVISGEFDRQINL